MAVLLSGALSVGKCSHSSLIASGGKMLSTLISIVSSVDLLEIHSKSITGKKYYTKVIGIKKTRAPDEGL